MAKTSNKSKIKPQLLKDIKSSRALELDYYKRLKDLSLKINRSVIYWALARYNKSFDKNLSKQLAFEFNDLLTTWDKKTGDIAAFIAKKVTKETEKYVNFKFKSQGDDYDIKRRTKLIKDQLQATYERNLSLIKTLPSEIIERYRSTFLNNIGAFDREALFKQARTFVGISNRRARTIARDQTQKAVSNYTQARAKSLGFEYYKWETAHDERVSKGKGGHDKLNDRIYRYDNATAVIDSYGTKGHPSLRVNCRCTAVAIIPRPNETFKLVKDSAAGDYYILQEKN